MTDAPPADLLSQVPLTDLAAMPPNSVEPALFLRRALDAEKKAKSYYRELTTERAQRKQLEDDVELLLAQSEVLESLDSSTPEMYETYEPEPSYSGGDATAMLVLTDWHCEEQVDPSTINGLNEFNLDIAAKRVEKCVQRFLLLLDSVRSISNIHRIAIPVLGDMITGHLHDDQKESNYLSPTEALMFARDHLHSAIDTIVKETGVEQVDIYTSAGNHGRISQKPRVSTAHKQSYEWLLYKWMEKDYRNEPKVKWHVVNSYFNLANIEGKRVRFHHGDEIRYNGGGGGITIPVLKAIRNWDDGLKSDLDVFGHWHQFLRHPKFVSCNCLIGYNAYAQRRVKAAFSHPSQTFIVIDRDRPGAVDVREVFCD